MIFLRRLLLFPIVTLLAFAAFLSGCDAVQETDTTLAHSAAEATTETIDVESRMAMRGHVVLANRVSGTVSVISTRTDAVLRTVPLPQAEGEPLPEPMYIAYDAPTDRVFVGDRANNRVVAYDARNGSIVGTTPATGVFHLWVDPLGNQLWVVDDVNNQMTVIDPATLSVLTTVPVTGGVPHDTVLEPDGSFAYVSISVENGADQIVKYSTDTFLEVDRADVGEDPHLSLNDLDGQLYSPCQASDAIYVLDRATLDLVTVIDVPGAHSAVMVAGGKFFFSTNIIGGGTDGLFGIDTRTNSVVGSIDTTPNVLIPTPHNIAALPSGGKVYVTHSGNAANETTVYTLDPNEPLNPDRITSEVIEVGLNPFGIVYVPSR